MSKEYYSIQAISKILGVTSQTIRNWHSSGRLKAHHIGPNGYRYYSEEQIQEILRLKENESKLWIGYTRVSDASERDCLTQQIHRLNVYFTEQQQNFEIIQDIGSGLDYSRPGFQKILTLINDNKIGKIVTVRKNTLLRFGFDLLKMFAAAHNISVEILDRRDGETHEEIFKDILQTLIKTYGPLDIHSVDNFIGILNKIKTTQILGDKKDD